MALPPGLQPKILTQHLLEATMRNNQSAAPSRTGRNSARRTTRTATHTQSNRTLKDRKADLNISDSSKMAPKRPSCDPPHRGVREVVLSQREPQQVHVRRVAGQRHLCTLRLCRVAKSSTRYSRVHLTILKVLPSKGSGYFEGSGYMVRVTTNQHPLHTEFQPTSPSLRPRKVTCGTPGRSWPRTDQS